MDNFKIDVVCEGREMFDLTMQIGLQAHSTITGYRVDAKLGFVLYWTKSTKATPFPYAMKRQAVADFVWGWLTEAASYGPPPDHDGDNGKGFRVYNESWGHVGGEWEACLAIQPAWAMYGK